MASAVKQQEIFAKWKHRVNLGGKDDFGGFSAWNNQRFTSVEHSDLTNAAAADCELDLVCVMLRNIPDYGPEATAIHTMYRTRGSDSDTRASIVAELLGQTPDSAGIQRALAWLLMVMSFVAIWYLLALTYFAAYGRKTLVYAPEEVFALRERAKEAEARRS